MKQELICIGCPMGCQLTAEVENGAVTTVTGNTCPRGAAYARKECVAPVRTVTGTVAIQGAALPVLPVRTNGEVPKALEMLDSIDFPPELIVNSTFERFEAYIAEREARMKTASVL